MNKPLCIRGNVFLWLTLVIGALSSTQVFAQEPQPPHQLMIGDSGPMTTDKAFAILGPGCGNTTAAEAITMATAKEEERRIYRVSLKYETPAFVLAEMDCALAPDDGPMMLHAGETIRYPFRISGLSAIIPDRRSNAMLVLCNEIGYGALKMIVQGLDIPIRHTTSPPTAPLPVARITQQLSLVSIASDSTVAPTEESAHLYRLPLTYTSPDFVLSELNQAYVPDSGIIILKPGEVTHNGFKIDGIRLIIPNKHDNSLLLVATPAGYIMMKAIVQILDVPAVSVSGVTPAINPKASGPRGVPKKAISPEQPHDRKHSDRQHLVHKALKDALGAQVQVTFGRGARRADLAGDHDEPAGNRDYGDGGAAP